MDKQCRVCGEVLSEDKFNSKSTRCKFCDWKHRNKNKIELYPTKYKDKKYELMTRDIFFGEVYYINDLCEKYNTELLDICDFLYSYAKIGNKTYRVRVKCENCGTDIDVHISKIMKSNFQFCSHLCYSNFRKKYYVGEKASVYKKVEFKCTYCGKPLMVSKWDMNTLNKKGENHNFCDHDCYSKFRSLYYRGDNVERVKRSEESRKRMSIATTKKHADGVYSHTNTKPQKIINETLDSLNIKYINEYLIKYYAVDNYLKEYDLMIEVMGDYFHANPIKYKDMSVLNKIQIKDVNRDKRKNTYIKKYHNIDVLYLWEGDINNNLELCKKLIVYYIKNNGIIENYNSFNYILNKNNELELKKEIKNPFFKLNP